MVAREVHPSVEALIGADARREPLVHSDSKSGASLERVVIDGAPFVLKHLRLADDWTMRIAGDLECATSVLWQRGVLDRLPAEINQPMVGVAHDPATGAGGRDTTLLMHDIGAYLVPPGDDPISLEQHRDFLDHMAAMHAAFWNAGDEIDCIPMTNRYLELSPWLAIVEAELGSDHVVPRLVAQGWERLREIAPSTSAIVEPLAWDPTPLVAALTATPLTLVHGNWKFGNLGTDPDGRTIVIDWENPGRGAPTSDLAWYLAINSARLPESKELAIEAYRASLEARGIETDAWWDTQIALTLLGGLVLFGWEKALGGPGAELDWWSAHAERGADQLVAMSAAARSRNRA